MWTIKEDLNLAAFAAYPVFSAFNNHDVKEYIYTTHTVFGLIPVSHSEQITEFLGLSHGLAS